MIFGWKKLPKLLVAAALAGCAAGAARAGSMDITWDAVSDPDLAGYKVYYDTRPGGAYRDSVPSPSTSHTLVGLSDCTLYYVAIKAIDAGMLESTDFSNEISGFPHPQITSIDPSGVAPGQTVDITINGSSFAPGAFAEITGVTVNSSTVDACGRMRVSITVDPSAPSAPADVTVVNSDGGFSTLQGGLQIGQAFAAFVVDSTTPPSGATDIDPTTTVQVRFSLPLDTATVKASRFKVLTAGTNKKAKLDASATTVDAEGTTVTLHVFGTLQAGQAYHVSVKGGKLGVLDSSGRALTADYDQSPGFTTAEMFGEFLFGPTGSQTPSQPLADGAVVPPTSVFAVRFEESIDPASVKAANFKILNGKKKIALKDKVPALSADGLSVLLEPAEAVPDGASLKIVVKGGKLGVKSARGVTMASLTKTVAFTATSGSIQGVGIAE